MVQIGKMNRLSIKGIKAYGLQEGEEVDLLVYPRRISHHSPETLDIQKEG